MDSLTINRWHEAISHRISRRSFDSKDIGPQELASFREFCHDFRPFPGVRAKLGIDSSDVSTVCGVDPVVRITG